MSFSGRRMAVPIGLNNDSILSFISFSCTSAETVSFCPHNIHVNPTEVASTSRQKPFD
ncbi:hypothetical protein MPTK1_3g16670 [Marchantia polymorpha subsp. ruderalis]|uniref:Uncharacterized protein n=2 Tax=Marchantia polymorpha TaxID=3197 RepID=A0AAF6B1J8_MARPO|nr:hypothetical protein MARPO_0004s0004 [Marchantia polymorpha]PTQ48694.1 hypothetical protein MARPO_0004s0004 [Marchantia polymorpha]BBN05882.1 hypothetical protein Mp_3g16670 [Marchantia polymorpha subsp. ruderalis]BBN05883.1 hypothetical protein Mp_3g16670 [Marchantia polymorpha subsp. ruderalis]|eukprot:PTQ48693.1 hypothetical protein MARPO_0004s0004 [Marchantia polymorpha]